MQRQARKQENVRAMLEGRKPQEGSATGAMKVGKPVQPEPAQEAAGVIPGRPEVGPGEAEGKQREFQPEVQEAQVVAEEPKPLTPGQQFQEHQKQKRKYDNTYKQAINAGYPHQEAHNIANELAGAQFPDPGEKVPSMGEQVAAQDKKNRQYKRTYKQAKEQGYSHEEAHQIANEHSGANMEDL